MDDARRARVERSDLRAQETRPSSQAWIDAARDERHPQVRR